MPTVPCRFDGVSYVTGGPREMQCEQCELDAESGLPQLYTLSYRFLVAFLRLPPAFVAAVRPLTVASAVGGVAVPSRVCGSDAVVDEPSAGSKSGSGSSPSSSGRLRSSSAFVCRILWMTDWTKETNHVLRIPGREAAEESRISMPPDGSS